MSKKSIKNIAVGIVTSLALMMSSFTAVHAQGFISPGDSPQAIQTATGGTGSFRQLALTIVNFFLTFLGLIAVVMIIYGGFLYVSAAGNQEKIESAKKIIMYAVIGIIVILLSFAIVNTVLTAGTGGATT
ncbi:MAG: pilin [Candidatus Gracilibacteria bacterium]